MKLGKRDAPAEKVAGEMAEKFAAKDTKTNWYDEVMSIGVVIADTETKKKLDSIYYIIDPEYRVGVTRTICRNIQDMKGMISCVWHPIASIIEPYRIL